MTVRVEVFEKALEEVFASIGVEKEHEYITRDQCRLLFNLILNGSEVSEIESEQLN